MLLTIYPSSLYFCEPDGNIFLLDKLLIPINIPGFHFFVICVYMKEKRIRVLDSAPDRKTGRLAYLKKIYLYLQKEYATKHEGSDLLNNGSWKLEVSSPTDGVPRQSSTSNDCGVYTCLFMDFLLLNLPLEVLTQERIAKFGREWVCKCLLSKSIVF